MQKKTLLTAMLAAGFALSVQAEQFIDPIIVTATRTAQTVDETLASVTVITREEIERLQPAQLSDLLQSRAGIHIADNGPFGKNTSLFMRGTNSDHTLLLIDGVRMGSATSGGASWQFLPVSEIERIEIVRGPRASIYGADAIGGVIQIFTRRNEAGPARVNAYVRSGSFGTREFGAGMSSSTKQTSYNLSASHNETSGINVRNIGEDDKDGYVNSSLSANITHRLKNDAELFATLLHSNGNTEYDGTPNETDFVHQALSTGLRGMLADNWWSELSLAQSRDEGRNYGVGNFYSRFNTARDLIDWRNDFSLGESASLTLGVDWQQEKVDSTTNYDETRRYNRAIYQVLQSTLGHHNLQASLRHDDNEAYGGHTTGQLAWGYAISPRLRSRLSWGTAFKAPTFNQLYWPNTGFGGGNSELEPEKSETFEGGLRYNSGTRYLDIGLFQTEVENLISGWPPQNVAKARMQGLEIETGLKYEDWHVNAALSFLEHQNLATSNELVRRPRETFRLDLDRNIGTLGFGGSVIAQGQSFDNAANTQKISGYGLLNLRASWRAAPDWTIRSSINNALDTEYQNALGFNQPGRAYYISVHYQH